MLSTKPPRCKWCKERTERIGKPLHDACVDPWYEANKEKLAKKVLRARASEQRARAKVERAETKRRKEKAKRVSEWEEECRRIVQKIARLRDRNDGCISCHLPPSYGDQPGSWGRQWHGSHYRSVGACSNLQFHLWNIHKACASCNKDKGGNIHAYRPRLVEKIGADRVAWLDSQNKVEKRSGPAYIEYLKRFKAVMGKRLRRMEKRLETA